MSRAENLDDLLDAVGLSIAVVAKRSGTSPRAILGLRRGEIARARATTVAKLAKALRVDPVRVRAAIEASRAARKP